MTTATADVFEAKDQAYKILALDKIRESKTNPRKTFNAQALEDLAKSVKEKGIIVPPLVRPVDDHFEIVAGARRFRAARKAGLEEIPVLVRELTDEQALEAQVIENLQRADVHPLEEGEGYDALLKTGKYDVEGLATKVGKSLSYIYQRLKLAELIDPAKKAFVEEKITAGHAIMIARLQEKDQKEALDACFSDEWRHGSNGPVLVSTRSLAGWIADNIHLDLHSAPFKKDDAELVPAAGACTKCPKRTGNCPQLFDDIAKKDTCTDRECFQSKQLAFVNKTKADLEGTGKEVEFVSRDWDEKRKEVLKRDEWQPAAANKGKCEDTKIGIQVGREEFGKVIQICANKNCRNHRERSSSGYDGKPSRTAEEEKKHQAELLKQRITARQKEALYKAIVGATRKIGRAELELLGVTGQGLPYGIDIPELEKIEGNYGEPKLAKATDVELAQYLVAIALSSELSIHRPSKNLSAAAKRLELDQKGIEAAAAEAERQATAHKDRIRKWRASAKSKKQAFEEPTCSGCGCTEATACPSGCSWTKLNKKTNVGVCSACEGAKK